MTPNSGDGGPYKTVVINAPTAQRVEKTLNEMAAAGWALHSQPIPLTYTKNVIASLMAIFARSNIPPDPFRATPGSR